MSEQAQLIGVELKPAAPRLEPAPSLSFFIPGTPCPGGSKRGFAIKKGGQYTGKVAMVDMGGERTKNWRQSVVAAAWELAPKVKELLRGPLRVDFEFIMPRPKYHYHTRKGCKGQLRGDAAHWHTSAPDRTKLMRSTEDALTGVLFNDDAQIVDGVTTKGYGDRPGCNITITPL